MTVNKLTSNEIGAANRAEVTPNLTRAGYRVHRPEADISFAFGGDFPAARTRL